MTELPPHGRRRWVLSRRLVRRRRVSWEGRRYVLGMVIGWVGRELSIVGWLRLGVASLGIVLGVAVVVGLHGWLHVKGSRRNAGGGGGQIAAWVCDIGFRAGA